MQFRAALPQAWVKIGFSHAWSGLLAQPSGAHCETHLLGGGRMAQPVWHPNKPTSATSERWRGLTVLGVLSRQQQGMTLSPWAMDLNGVSLYSYLQVASVRITHDQTYPAKTARTSAFTFGREEHPWDDACCLDQAVPGSHRFIWSKISQILCTVANPVDLSFKDV